MPMQMILEACVIKIREIRIHTIAMHLVIEMLKTEATFMVT